ncbi:MAG: DNA polymerase Y family protein [Acidimicrobiales bacterium]
MRVAVLWCPDWPVVAFKRLPSEPVAVIHANRVVAASVSARQHGVERNLRRREAQSRCPSLVVLDRDQQVEARLFEAVVASLDDLTPRVEIVRPGKIVFPTRGPSRYFGGDLAMAQHGIALARQVLDGFGSVRIGVADGAFAASAAARRAVNDGVVEDGAVEDGAAKGAVHVVPEGGSPRFLAPFPVSTLDRPDLVGVLTHLGLHTLGQFGELSRADVLARFGADGAVAHRLASGLDERPPAVSDPPPGMEVSTELDPPVERVDQAAFVGKALADRFLEKLESRGASCTRVIIAAETEHGEELVRCWRHEGALTAAAVADRVRWQLDGWLNGSSARRPSGCLSLLSIRPEDIVAAKGRQLGFWGGQTEAAERATRVVARVQGILGPGAVRVPERRGGRSPQEQVVTVPADTVDLDRSHINGAMVVAPWPGALPGPAPMRVHGDPLEAQVVGRNGVVVGVDGRALLSAEPQQVWVQGQGWHHIQHWAGPWPLDERWWDQERRRRRARLQVVVQGGMAFLLVIEDGHWWVEATYD